jgi:hypothetical protein
MKSTLIDSQGCLGTFNGFNKPYGFWFKGLLRLQVMQVPQKAFILETMSSHHT